MAPMFSFVPPPVSIGGGLMPDPLTPFPGTRGTPPGWGPDRSPEEAAARLAEITAAAEAEFDAANPGLRAYNRAREANPMGRPFYNGELAGLPAEQAQNAGVTLGGNWGNAFGEIDDDPFLQALRERQPVVTQTGVGGERNTTYPGGSGEQIYGGDTTVRNVGGRNMFVDRNPNAIPVPEGGYGNSPEFAAKVAETGRSSSVMPKLGDPQARAEYLARMAAEEDENRDITRRNYQVSHNFGRPSGLRVVPGAPMWQNSPEMASDMAKIQAMMMLEQTKLGASREEAAADRALKEKALGMEDARSQADRESRIEQFEKEMKGRAVLQGQEIEGNKEVAKIGATKGQDQLQPEQAAILADLLRRREAGELSDEEFAAGLGSIRGKAPAAGTMPMQEGGPRTVLPTDMHGMEPDAIVGAMRKKGRTDEEIDAVLQQITGNSYASVGDPDGITWKDWAYQFVPVAGIGAGIQQLAPGGWSHPAWRIGKRALGYE